MSPSINHFSAQSYKILEILQAAAGAWVPLPEIQACAAQYNARIFELRRRGYRIENRTQLVGASRHSWFRLVPDSIEPRRITSEDSSYMKRVREEAAAACPLFAGSRQ